MSPWLRYCGVHSPCICTIADHRRELVAIQEQLISASMRWCSTSRRFACRNYGLGDNDFGSFHFRRAGSGVPHPSSSPESEENYAVRSVCFAGNYDGDRTCQRTHPVPPWFSGDEDSVALQRAVHALFHVPLYGSAFQGCCFVVPGRGETEWMQVRNRGLNTFGAATFSPTHVPASTWVCTAWADNGCLLRQDWAPKRGGNFERWHVHLEVLRRGLARKDGVKTW